MPVIAVAAAVAATAFAAADIAAVGLTVATAFEAVAAVGATIAAVGTIARDKTLTMVGGAIGIVGAIGGIASAAGVFGTAADAPIFGAAPAASTSSAAADTGATFADSLTPATTGSAGGVEGGAWDAAAAATAADNASANTIPFVANGLPQGQKDLYTFSSVSDNVTNPADAVTQSIDPAAKLAGAQQTSTIDQTTGLQTSTATSTDGTVGAAGNATPPRVQIASDASNPSTYGPTSTFDTGNAAGAGAGTADKPGVFDQILKFAKDNKELTSGVLTVGGKMLEGMFSTVDPAKVQALQAQAAANNAAAAMANQQRANLAMPKAVASSAPVTGTPNAIIPPRPQGIINQPQGLAPVTGAVA